MKKLFILTVLLVLADTAHAHPGGTNADGSHYCWTNCEEWGEEYGKKHFHGRCRYRILPSEDTEEAYEAAYQINKRLEEKEKNGSD